MTAGGVDGWQEGYLKLPWNYMTFRKNPHPFWSICWSTEGLFEASVELYDVS